MDAGWTQIYIECKWTGPLLSQRTILDAIGLWCWDEIIFFLFSFLVNCNWLIVDGSLFGSAHSDHCSNNESSSQILLPRWNWELVLACWVACPPPVSSIRKVLRAAHQIVFMQMPSDQAPVHQTGTQWSDSIYIEDVRNSSNFANYKLLLPQKGNCKEFWQSSGQG